MAFSLWNIQAAMKCTVLLPFTSKNNEYKNILSVQNTHTCIYNIRMLVEMITRTRSSSLSKCSFHAINRSKQ